MRQSPFYSRRSFLRIGAGIAAGTSMAASAETDLVSAQPVAAGEPSGSGNPPVAQAQKTLRPFGPFFANHNADTGLHLWSIERWKQEISDSRRMGTRSIWYLPFEFGEHSRHDLEDTAPYFTLQRGICRAIVRGRPRGGHLPGAQ